VTTQQAQAQYDVAVTNLKFAAFLVVEDAWNDLVDARRAGAS